METRLDIAFWSATLTHAPHKRIRSLREQDKAELIVVISGVYHATVSSEAGEHHFKAQGGDVVLWPQDARREEESDPESPAQAYAIYFDWKDAPLRPPVVVYDYFRVIRTLAAHLVTIRKTKQLDYRASFWNACLSAILEEFFRLANHPSDNLLAPVIRYLDENLNKKIRLTELAEMAGLHPRHFGRQFRKRVGVTPMKFIRLHRVQRAIQLIESNAGLPLNVVASRVGIPDVTHLRRLIRRHADIRVRDLRGYARGRKREQPHFLPYVPDVQVKSASLNTLP